MYDDTITIVLWQVNIYKRSLLVYVIKGVNAFQAAHRLVSRPATLRWILSSVQTVGSKNNRVAAATSSVKDWKWFK